MNRCTANLMTNDTELKINCNTLSVTMQDINERERERVDQSQTQRYVLRFESLLYVPSFTQKNFH